MTKLKVVNQKELKDWAKEIFQKNSFNMVDVSSKKKTFRRALASGKISIFKSLMYVFVLCTIAFLILIQFYLF